MSLERQTSADALEKFINSKIPLHLRPNYDRDISMIRGGWDAASDFFRSHPPGICHEHLETAREIDPSCSICLLAEVNRLKLQLKAS